MFQKIDGIIENNIGAIGTLVYLHLLAVRVNQRVGMVLPLVSSLGELPEAVLVESKMAGPDPVSIGKHNKTSQT